MTAPPRKPPPLQYGLASLLLAILAVIACVPVAFLGFTYWVMQMPAVPESKLAQMRVGMSREEVRQLLGSPSHDKGSYWIYRRMTWAHLNVCFDAGNLRDFEHDF